MLHFVLGHSEISPAEVYLGFPEEFPREKIPQFPWASETGQFSYSFNISAT